METLSIGTMAKLNGTTPRALRFYASKGLLQPKHVDPETGFRYYDIRQCYDLDRIQELQSLGCTLEEIAQVMGSPDDEAYRNLLIDKAWEYEEQRRALEERSALAEGLLKKCRTVESLPVLDTPSIETLPARTMVRVDVSELDPACADQGVEHVRLRWEYISRTIKGDLQARGVPVAAMLNAGCGISRDNLVARSYVFDRFFLLEDEVPLGEEARRETLPAGEYAVLYSAGNSDENGLYKTPRNLDRLLDFIQARGYNVAGDYFDEILGETPDADGGRSVFFKMNIPVVRGK